MFDNLRGWLAGAIRTVADVLHVDPAGDYRQRGGSMAGRIYDGAEYRVPVPITAADQRMGSEHVDAKLREASDTFRHQFGSPYQTGEPVQMLSTALPLHEWSWQTRVDVIEQCHLAWERNPLAKRIVAYTNMYAVQGGSKITAQNKEVGAVIDAFIDNPDNAFRETEKGIIPALMMDGELFVRFFAADGETVWAPLVPWGVRAIRHEAGFFRRVEAYEYNVTQDNGSQTARVHRQVAEDIPADEVLHTAVNRKIYEQRGRPDLFAILPWLRAHKEWLENRARQNFWRGAVLFWVKLINATAPQVATKLGVYKQPPSPGSVWVTNDKEEVEQMSPNVGASDANADGREMRLMVASGGGVPEYFLADGSMTNLATASKQELPALMGFAEYQDLLRDNVIVPTIKRVIRNAVEAGLLPERVEVEDADGDAVEDTEGAVRVVDAVDAFDVVYPELERESPKDALEALLMGINADLLSDETATGLMPWQVDYRQEQKRILAENERKMEQIASGQRMSPFAGMGTAPFGANGNPATEPQSEREPDGNQEQAEAA